MIHALPLALAMVLDALLGEPRWLWARVPHPAVLIGRAIGWLDGRLNHAPYRRLKGMGVVAVLITGATAVGIGLTQVGPIVETLIAAILLAQKSLSDHVRAVADALRLSTGDGRRAVARIVSRDCRTMTQADAARAGIESAAENLSDGVVAPAFWFLVAGLPGIIVYKSVNTADSMIGYRNERYREFGWAAARLDDLMNLIPARLTALIIALIAGKMAFWSGIAQDARHHKSPNAGWPEAAMARALGVALAGPRSYDGEIRDLAWVNSAAPRDIGPDQVDAALAMLWKVWLACLVVVATIAALGALILE